MTGPNLEPGRKALERLMEDTCKISIDPQSTGDDSFNQESGQYTPPPDDVRTVYEGDCLLSGQANVGREGNRTGGSFQIVGYKLQLPLSAPLIPVGAWVEITGSKRDPLSVGKKLQVAKPVYSTLTMTRSMTCVSEEEVPVV